MKLFVSVLTIIIISSLSITKAQNSSVASEDSIKFKQIQDKLDGCWKTKYYQFSYNKNKNSGWEYKSRIQSSAPFFSLKIVDNEIFIAWTELLGGSHLQKILSIKKNKLIVENDNGHKITYKRNINCS